METQHARTELLFGTKALETFRETHVFLAGLGGVGGACLEALARAGIGRFTLVDDDVFTASNLNRQLLATPLTLDRPKAEVAEERVALFGDAEVSALQLRLTPDNVPVQLALAAPDVVIDCIDDLKAKKVLLEEAVHRGLPVISAGGAGNRIDPTGVVIDWLEKVTCDPLAKRLRRELSHLPKRSIRYCFIPRPADRKAPGPVASSPYVPNIFGFTMAGHILEQLAAQ